MKKLLSAAVLAAFAISGHAALQDRDMDHNGFTDAFYDTDLNITWLRDANYALTSGADHDGALDGKMTWEHANTWANSVTISGYNGWRLPTTLVATVVGGIGDSSCGPGLANQRASAGSNCSGSEMGHLYYTELGNIYKISEVGTHVGSFLNLESTNNHWSGTSFVTDSGAAYVFNLGRGNQGKSSKASYGSNLYYAMLVRPGDISPAPEPETYAMLLAGLGLMGAVARRRMARQA